MIERMEMIMAPDIESESQCGDVTDDLRQEWSEWIKPFLRGLSLGLFLLTCLARTTTAATPPKWQRHAFPLPEGIWSVEALDATGDGRLDLIAMGETKIFTLVAPDWDQRVLADFHDGKMLYCVAWDADGDGDMDLAVGRYRVPWIEYRQARAENKTLAEPKGPEFSLAWIENPGMTGAAWPVHVLDRELNGIHGLSVGDLNGDGRPDLVADSIMGPSFQNSLVWFQAPMRGRGQIERHVITRGGADGRPHYLDVADLDGDGRNEVLLGDSQGGTFTWWQQNADGVGPWRKSRIASVPGATNIRAARVNRDGVLDVVGSCGHGKGVFWFAGPTWESHVIDLDFATPHALAAGDFDGDGDVDVAAASYSAFVVRWYENDGNGSFVIHEIESSHQQQAYDMKTVDLNADARVDLILAGRESRNAVWYENK